jgi:hypothetical protein
MLAKLMFFSARSKCIGWCWERFYAISIQNFKCCKLWKVCPTWRTNTANQRGGSEWEPIKILLERDRGSNKMNTASNTRFGLTTHVGQDHAATGVLLALGTNNQLHGLENATEQQLEPHWPTPVRPVSTTGQTGPTGETWELPQKGPYTGQAGVAHRSDRFKPRNPQSTKQAYRAPNCPTWNNSNTVQQRTHPNVHPSKTQ